MIQRTNMHTVPRDADDFMQTTTTLPILACHALARVYDSIVCDATFRVSSASSLPPHHRRRLAEHSIIYTFTPSLRPPCALNRQTVRHTPSASDGWVVALRHRRQTTACWMSSLQLGQTAKLATFAHGCYLNLILCARNIALENL